MKNFPLLIMAFFALFIQGHAEHQLCTHHKISSPIKEQTMSLAGIIENKGDAITAPNSSTLKALTSVKSESIHGLQAEETWTLVPSPNTPQRGEVWTKNGISFLCVDFQKSFHATAANMMPLAQTAQYKAIDTVNPKDKYGKEQHLAPVETPCHVLSTYSASEAFSTQSDAETLFTIAPPATPPSKGDKLSFAGKDYDIAAVNPIRHPLESEPIAYRLEA